VHVLCSRWLDKRPRQTLRTGRHGKIRLILRSLRLAHRKRMLSLCAVLRWYHNGVDITTGFNDDPIYAAQTGVVIFAGWDPYGGGLSVKLAIVVVSLLLIAIFLRF